jgi:hypothetical protein
MNLVGTRRAGSAGVRAGAARGGNLAGYALVGVPLGSRVLVVAPATESSQAAAMVVDVVDQVSTSD